MASLLLSACWFGHAIRNGNSPMQRGWVPLQLPSLSQSLVAVPTRMRDGVQLKETSDW